METPLASATVVGVVAGGLIVQLANSIISILNTNHKHRMEDNSKVVAEQSKLIDKLQKDLDKEINKTRNYERAIDWIMDAQIAMKKAGIEIRAFVKEGSGLHVPLSESPKASES